MKIYIYEEIPKIIQAIVTSPAFALLTKIYV